MMSQTLQSITGVMGRRGFFGMIEVAFLIPFNSNSKRGQLPSGKGVLGPLVMWRCLTAARYVLMVCHLSPFNPLMTVDDIHRHDNYMQPITVDDLHRHR